MPHALMVDGDVAVRRVATSMLAKLGFTVDVASTVAEAATAASAIGTIDLALVDWDMHPDDGVDLLARLRHRPNGKLVGVVFASARRRDRPPGVDALVPKPLTFVNVANALLEAQRAVIRRAQV